MKITRVNLKNLETGGRLKAIGSITFDDVFVVTDVGVVEGSKGLFVSMPSKKVSDKEFKNTAFPINSDFRKEITYEVLAVYERNMEEAEALSEAEDISGNTEDAEGDDEGVSEDDEYEETGDEDVEDEEVDAVE